jgi:hypothetical protein
MEDNFQRLNTTLETTLQKTLMQINSVASTTVEEVIRKVNVAMDNKSAVNNPTTCFKCNNEGHWSKDCPLNNFGPQQKKQKTHDSCILCGATNHTADHCHEAFCTRCQQPGHLAQACATNTDNNRRLFMGYHNNRRNDEFNNNGGFDGDRERPEGRFNNNGDFGNKQKRNNAGFNNDRDRQ